MTSPEVSIIIPAYNCERFIGETLDSILLQDADMQIILVDDGSTDGTKAAVAQYQDPRLQYIYQQNKGVSAARNTGFEKAVAAFVVFFDSDDRMPPGFITSRLSAMQADRTIDVIGGEVKKFGHAGMLPGYFRGPEEKKTAEQILLYDSETITCPSGFMIRSAFLRQYEIFFNEKLSSTADRFFLLQCTHHGRIVFDPAVEPLFYRVSAESMSNRLDEKLAADNEKYYNELKASVLIPGRIKNNSLFLGDFILSGSSWKTGKKWKALKYGCRCFFRNPIGMIRKLNRL